MNTTKRPLLFPSLFLLVVIGAAYGHTLPYPFQFDGRAFIVRANAFSDPLNLAQLWQINASRLLPNESFALNYALHGLWPVGYRMVNLLFHFGASLTLFLLARDLRDGWRPESSKSVAGRLFPLTVSLLFALHPLQTQGVTYIWQRYTCMSAFLYLLALHLYLRWAAARDRGAPDADRLLAWATVAAMGAMFVKEIAVTLPVAAVAADLLFVGRSWSTLRARSKGILVFAAVASIPLFLTLMGGSRALADLESRTTTAIPALHYWMTQVDVVAPYLKLFVWPTGQSIEHVVPVIDRIGGVWPLILVHLALAGSAVAALRRNPLYSYGVFFFYLALSVESLVPLIDPVFEHRMYLPMAGLLLALLSWGLVLPLRAGIGLTVAALLVTIPLGVATYQRNLVWRTGESLWLDAHEKAPNARRPFVLLARDAIERGEKGKALHWFGKVTDAYPTLPLGPFMTGRIHVEAGRLAEAAIDFREAVRRSPGEAILSYRLGETLRALGDMTGAETAYRHCLAINPRLVDGWIGLALALESQEKTGEAHAAYQQVLTLAPGYPPAIEGAARTASP